MSKIHQQLFSEFSNIKNIKVQLDSGAVDAVVDEVKEMNSYTEEKMSFSVVIKIDEETIQEQGVYQIDLEGFDSLHVFMVPINRIQNSSFYEIVFN